MTPEITAADRANGLLSTLAREDYDLLAPHMRPVTYQLGEVLFQPGDKIDYVYFPKTCIVSLLTDL
jgi:CRP-like cAMP-binding protein